MSEHEPKKQLPLRKLSKLATSSNTTETILNIFKAVLATAPFCGGIASLITDYIPSARFQRLEKFAEQVAEDLLELSDRIDESYIKTDDFAFMFEKCFRGVAENPQKEKMNAFRGILINSAVRKDYSEGGRDMGTSIKL
jgi:hypothetical protein